MPKIIENLKERLLDHASLEIAEVGYNAMTIQSVAKKCGVGVGTVYNYFSSKEDLLTACIARDWMDCVKTIQKVSADAQDCEAVVHCIYDQLVAFGRRHKAVFMDCNAAASIDAVVYRVMGFLCRQLAEPLRKFCKNDVDAQIIAEALLMWTRTGKCYADIEAKIRKMLD